jgi:hypothetical protein
MGWFVSANPNPSAKPEPLIFDGAVRKKKGDKRLIVDSAIRLRIGKGEVI